MGAMTCQGGNQSQQRNRSPPMRGQFWIIWPEDPANGSSVFGHMTTKGRYLSEGPQLPQPSLG